MGSCMYLLGLYTRKATHDQSEVAQRLRHLIVGQSTVTACTVGFGVGILYDLKKSLQVMKGHWWVFLVCEAYIRDGGAL